MQLSETAKARSETYLSAFDELIGDKRTRTTMAGIVEGIIAGESLRAARVARFSP